MNDNDLAAAWVPIGDLKPWDRNPRHNDAAVPHVQASIERFGFSSPIIARKADGVVIAGHTRLKAAQAMGMDKVPVRYMDLDPAQAAALAIADNRIAEIADWDDQGLADVLRDLNEQGVDLDGLGMDQTEIDQVLAATRAGGVETGDVPAPPPDDAAVSVSGERYQLGPHVLVCGDSTDPANYPEAESVGLVLTDPPYGVAYEAGESQEQLKARRRSQSRGSGHEIAGDLTGQDAETLMRSVFSMAYAATAPGGCWYVCCSLIGETGSAMNSAQKRLWRHTFVWLKDALVLGRADRHYIHENILYGWKDGAGHRWTGGRKRTSVIECPRPRVSVEHPTMKPVPLLVELLECHPATLVLDPFGGSGSTLIAAAQVGHRAHLIELQPKYCDVIRRRWGNYARKHGLDVGDGI